MAGLLVAAVAEIAVDLAVLHFVPRWMARAELAAPIGHNNFLSRQRVAEVGVIVLVGMAGWTAGQLDFWAAGEEVVEETGVGVIEEVGNL